VAKQPKTATKTIRGKTYKLQHPGVMWYLQNTDRSRDQNGCCRLPRTSRTCWILS